MHLASLRSAAVLSVLFGALCTCVSCGGDDDSPFGDKSKGGSAGSGINLGGSTGNRPGGGGSSAECSPGADDQGCVGTAFEGESIPLDIYVMFDLSCSMSCSIDKVGCCRLDDPDPEDDWRIQPVRQAMTAFLRDPASAGIGVGLGFFGDHDRSLDNDPAICSVEEHADATVGIELLPDAADQLIGELDAGLPQAGTPTHLAIDGACVYVDDWKQQHPDHKVVILLVTDGIPEAACGANIDLATQAATSCYDGGLGYQTYVLGVVANNSNSLDQLNGIAEAGGTEHAYLTSVDDVQGSVLAALNAIRGDAVIPCDLQLPDPPDGQQLDTGLVNLGICNSTGEAQVTPYVEAPADCDGPGWYYDDPSSPEAIQLCDATCETVSVPGAALFFTVGCATQTVVK